MKVSPEDLKQTTFSKSLRGYDVRLVNQFLYDLANDIENESIEKEAIKQNLTKTEIELNRLKEVETIMLKKIGEAEQSAAQIIAEATKQAEDTIKQAYQEANKVIMHGRAEASQIKENAQEESERLLIQTNETIIKVKGDAKADLADSFKEYNSLDLAKQQLIADLNSLIDLTHGRLSDIRTKYSPDAFDPKKVEVVPLAVLAKSKAKKESLKDNLEKVLDKKIAQKNKKTTAVEKPASKVATKIVVKPNAKVLVKTSKKEESEEFDGLPTVIKILQNNTDLQQNAVTTIPVPRAEKESSNQNFFDTI